MSSETVNAMSSGQALLGGAAGVGVGVGSGLNVAVMLAVPVSTTVQLVLAPLHAPDQPSKW